MEGISIKTDGLKCELYNDSMQSWKCYPIQKAQLIIADVPYNVGTNFYGSNPVWYKGGDNKNGESAKAGDVHKTIIAASVEGEHANCWRNGTRIVVLPGTAAKVQKRRKT